MSPEKCFNQIHREEIITRYVFQESVEQIALDLPYAVSTLYRTLDDIGLEKKIGRSSNSLSHLLLSLTEFVLHPRMSIEGWYKREATPSIKAEISLSNFNLVIRLIKKEAYRRSGVALICTPEFDYTKVLVAKDMTPPNQAIGKSRGAITIPMMFSDASEGVDKSVKRLLQHEVFTNLLIMDKFPTNMIYQASPLFKIGIADISTKVFHLPLPHRLLEQVGSPKLKDFELVDIEHLVNLNPLDPHIRPGVVESINLFDRKLESDLICRSVLNEAVMAK